MKERTCLDTIVAKSIDGQRAITVLSCISFAFFLFLVHCEVFENLYRGHRLSAFFSQHSRGYCPQIGPPLEVETTLSATGFRVFVLSLYR